MVCGLPWSCGFQPERPTASRAAMKLVSRVSSRRKWVWVSMTNWPFSAWARWAAMSGIAASAFETWKIGP